MERFNNIYPFTTENIAGYMNDLDLTNKKIITVTGSSDHIINAILKGSTNITTFDINPLTKYYMDLKLSAIRELSFEDFLKILLNYNNSSLDKDIILNLNMNKESKEFWIKQYTLYKNGVNLKQSSLFNTKYFNPQSKIWQNLYLKKSNYEIVKERLKTSKITFINKNLLDLEIKEEYDYMFLSNISDYLNKLFEKNSLINYNKLLTSYLNYVKYIYFAYLYDIGNNNPRSEIDDLNKVTQIFKNVTIKTFRSALENEKEKKDGVLILRRDKNVRK